MIDYNVAGSRAEIKGIKMRSWNWKGDHIPESTLKDSIMMISEIIKYQFCSLEDGTAPAKIQVCLPSSASSSY